MGKLELVIESDNVSIYSPKYDGEKLTECTVRLYCIRISDRLLILGNGGIKKVARFEDDPVLLGIVNQLRDIEHQIFVETRKAHSDYEDYQTIKTIIETITI